MHPHTDKYNENTHGKWILNGGKNNSFLKSKIHFYIYYQ
jgi:hypothetical protein